MREIKLHHCFNSLMTVLIMCSSTPLKKKISAAAVLIEQAGLEERSGETAEVLLLSGCNLTGTIVSFCSGIEKHLL